MSQDQGNIRLNSQEATRLFEILNQYDVPPSLLESGFQTYGNDSKNEVVRWIARSASVFHGKLLGRLPYILTAQNRDDMVTAFTKAVASTDPEARKAGIYGLQTLEDPAAVDAALRSLDDDDDHVVAAACSVLIPLAKKEARFGPILRDVYARHAGNAKYYLTTGLLEAHGFDKPQDS
jgi:HEAT repeat protein